MINTPLPTTSSLPGIDPLDLTAKTSNGRPGKDSAVDPNDLANKDVFLQLLIAQIKNQDPSRPGDSNQYLTQLSQFKGVEQLGDIKHHLQTMNEKIAALDTQSNP